MARWRLIQKHYLNVPGTEWEYRETNAETGKQVRKIFPVPAYLDPDDRSDWNYRDEGIIVVCDGNGAKPKDIIFVGSPTPDMVPLDDEAEAISAQYADVWKHPIETLGDEGFGGSIVAELGKLLATQKPSSPVPDTDLADIKSQIAAMMAEHRKLAEENSKLRAAIEDRGELRRM